MCIGITLATKMAMYTKGRERQWQRIKERPTRPNIVFVLCDNTGWGDFSCYGGSTPTPA